MFILGINCFLKDSSACLIKDGNIIASAEEERFVREKHTGIFPKNAISYCLKEAGIKISDISHIGFCMKPWKGFHKRLFVIARNLPDSLSFYHSHSRKWFCMLRLRTIINEMFKVEKEKYKLHFIEHHLSHAGSSFFLSGYEKSAILTVDGSGEIASCVSFKGEGNDIKKISEIYFPHSLGYLYGAVTQYLGFKQDSDEGKVMALASYGEPSYLDAFRKIVKIKKNGRLEFDLTYFDYQKGKRRWVSDKFIKVFGKPRQPDCEIENRHKEIASSLQHIVEESFFHLANYLYEKTKMKNLCIAGGVCLNSVLNGKIIDNTPFENLFVQPVANDAGCSIGCCYYIYNNLLREERNNNFNHLYFGPSYSEERIKETLQLNSIKYEYHSNIAEATAKLLIESNVIGWFQGRMELGPRALGNRSIIADPRKMELKELVNKKVKMRESFRPFAPSILKEKCKDYFEKELLSPFMVLVYKFKDEVREKVPAVVHYDGTGRLHTVDKTVNPLFWELINSFYKLTGIPIILNTSFNVKEKPIVNTPEEAVEIFLKTDMDVLVMGNFLIRKKR